MKPEKIERRPSSEERIEVLRDLFPEVLTDGRVNVDRLRELLEGDASDASDTDYYGLRWPGKLQARRLANQASHVTLRPVPKAGIAEDATGNMVIVGDNLQVLLTLQKSYANSIKLIYIDPPYNTGSDFIYKDTFAVDEELYLQETRQADLQGRLVSNPQTGGRFHSSWLNFMYPRLAVARSLLSDTGSLWISIDDKERSNLCAICDEIFGEENRVATFVWEKRTTRENRKVFSVNHDYVVCYARNKEQFQTERRMLPLSEDVLGRYENPDNDPRGDWQSVSLNAQAGHATKDQFYELTLPSGRKVSAPPGRCWVVTKRRMEELIVDNRVWFGAKGDNTPRRKAFLSEAREGLTPHTLWTAEEVGTNDSAKKALMNLFGGIEAFDTPKPVELIRRIVQIATNKDEGDIVLDFFAGSGTTGHSVWVENQAQNSNRRFILVQLDAPVDEKSASGKAVLDAGLDTIDKITCERLRRVSKAMKSEGVEGDFGFRVFKEDSPALARPLHLAAEQLEKGQLAMFREKLAHVQPGDLFTEVLLLLGFPLDTHREQVPQDSANTLWRFEHSRVLQPLLLCLDPKIDDDLLDALRDKKNHIFVCRDEALTDVAKARFYDALKVADATFKVL
ncbi:MAG: site-specific DNA-methyltransferase [Deltaproteobacteria bacterium]|nr:site-specific DNA-methyltransferase [Deltaproteobacteria bacterium]